jgi:TusA-related sulfurtransferase
MDEDIKINRDLNLKGTICPYNFIKSKLAIEEMKVGEVLRIVVDFKSAIDDVPHGMEFEGQKVLRVRQLNEKDWEIIVKKEH